MLNDAETTRSCFFLRGELCRCSSDATNRTNLLSAYVELVTAVGEATLLQGEGPEEPGSVDVQQPRGASSVYS
jgi:hypothetical protein